ncbi:MAG: hypothetical protein J2P45_25555, partial [Candidatus Dormibacteraeota bacterium]|nr:hypothetical protein [Candidatus Dormibacteraeota bacterium]
RIGRRWTRALVGGCFALALAAPVAAAILGWVPAFAVLPLLTLPAMLVVLRGTRSHEPQALIRALRRAAVIELWWALLWTLGVLL